MVGLTITLLERRQSGEVGLGLSVRCLLQVQQCSQRPNFGGQRGKIRGLRVEHRDPQLLDRCQHTGLGRAPGHHQIRFLGQQGFKVDAAVVGHVRAIVHFWRKIRCIIGGDDAIACPDEEQQLGQMGGQTDDAHRCCSLQCQRPAEQAKQGEIVSHGAAPAL